MTAKVFTITPRQAHSTKHTVKLWLEPEDFEPMTLPGKHGKQDVQDPNLCQVRAPANDKPFLPLDNHGTADLAARHTYLIIGFDTEYKTPDPLNRAQIKEGLGRVEILSYQFYAKTHNGHEWSGICLPDNNDRLSVHDFLTFALGTGARQHGLINLPRQLIMVGHFTRADIPAFSDFKDLQGILNAVRGSFVTIGLSKKPMELNTVNRTDKAQVFLNLRDTILLTPQASGSLKAVGAMIGIPKLELSEDRAEHMTMIRNMDKVRQAHWLLFREYALRDALICVRYLERIIQQNVEVTGSWKIPLTLTAIGVDLLQKHWRDQGLAYLEMVGKEEVYQRKYIKSKGRYEYSKDVIWQEMLSLHESLITECYHGGRNEQFWFGPGFEDSWTDYDLSSAYPTAMSAIMEPDWANAAVNNSVAAYKPNVLGFALVEFEFPESVRYPTLPVRTANGLVFPRTGKSYCAAPEIHLARTLKAKLTIRHGVIIPYKSERAVFGDFIKACIQKRMACGKSSFEGLFWKEVSNSTYGKLAQGLRAKRVYDLRSGDTKPLPPSKITNCAYAAYTTSFTRAVLGEAMNALPAHKMVFSCTTDGFLTNATDDDFSDWMSNGHFANYYALQRELLDQPPAPLEKKHQIKKPLGWRTRGQATLNPGDFDKNKPEQHIVLAKAGIYTSPELEETEQKNEEIVRLFFNRNGQSQLEVHGHTGLREIMEDDADFVEKIFSKRLSMEYDWKRRPNGLSHSTTHDHIAFSTPEFDTSRDKWLICIGPTSPSGTTTGSIGCLFRVS